MTTRLGWVTVGVGCLVLTIVMYNTWLMFGLPLEGGSIEGFRLKLILWIVLTVVIVPIAFYTGMILIYGTFSITMFVFGKLTWQQVVDLTWYAKYPKEWYKSNA